MVGARWVQGERSESRSDGEAALDAPGGDRRVRRQGDGAPHLRSRGLQALVLVGCARRGVGARDEARRGNALPNEFGRDGRQQRGTLSERVDRRLRWSGCGRPADVGQLVARVVQALNRCPARNRSARSRRCLSRLPRGPIPPCSEAYSEGLGPSLAGSGRRRPGQFTTEVSATGNPNPVLRLCEWISLTRQVR
jgi:hypothetical protein